MAQARLSVRKIREILRLRAEGFSERDIADSVGVARSSIQICLWRAERAGVGWPPPADQDDAALEALLYPRPKPGVEVHPTPDFEWIERELRRKHVTRRQLWREYLARYPDGLKYTAFCVKFQQWRRRRGVTMSLTHLPGDRLFVDYAGDPAFYTDPTTGMLQKAWIFVAVWPYSGLFYAEATRTQTSADWLGAHVRALEAFGVAPKAIVPDNCKTAVKKALRYNPEFNRSYSDFAQAYSLAVLPARVRRPRDKAAVEQGVLTAERAVLGGLRDAKFFSLAERPLSDQSKRDLLEILDDRYEKSATIITSQLEVKQWHTYLDDPTLADAILDRVVHNAYQLDLSGESIRKLKSLRAKNTKNGGIQHKGSASIAAPTAL